jgi:hypothetical protein
MIFRTIYSLSGVQTVLNAVNKYIVTEIHILQVLKTGKTAHHMLLVRVFTLMSPNNVKPIKKNPNPCLAVFPDERRSRQECNQSLWPE